eukprot:TRINITY_DN27132_c0_g2_i1.p1 TRINITY_DN27132_c0_g2~~TRINITY_DN27132_c0_g2_i1.p1  ORF type:complete len:1200 (-),score=148.82 TRINITY_DN27132_c0_g2_i1:168-3422(-)
MDWTCDVFDGKKPLYDFTSEFWPKPSTLAGAEDMISSYLAEDPEAKSRVIDMGALGYVAKDTIYIWNAVVADVENRTAGKISLDWWRNLQKDEAMQYFTPLRNFDISWGMYQYCEHADMEYLEAWGYKCNEDYEYDNPWRMPSSNGTWVERGSYPTRPRPLYGCSEFDDDNPLQKQLISRGYVCRGEGWWLAPPCLAKSPGDEYLDVCIPILTYNPFDEFRLAVGAAQLPAVVGCISIWDSLEEYIFDWAEAHTYRGGPPNVAIFYWWDPDASLRLNYEGSPDAVNSVAYSEVKFSAEYSPDGVTVSTLAHEDVFAMAQEVAALLQKFKLQQSDILNLSDRVVELSKTGGPNGTSLDLAVAKDEAACEWLLNHGHVWKKWIGADSCWADSYYDKALGRCRACPESYSSKRGSQGIESCKPCPKGKKYQAGQGCIPCEPGSFSNGTGSGCSLCPLGSYQPLSGAWNCTQCPAEKTTDAVGSHEIGSCLCDVNSYAAGDGCAACTLGMTCDQIGMSEPEQARGYYIRRSDFRVFKCIDVDACVEPRVGTCPGLREGLLCAACPATMISSDSGCVECSSMAYGGVAIAFLLAIGFCCGVYYFSNSGLTSNASTTLGVSLAAGILLTTVQVLGTFSELSVPWPQSFSSGLGAMSVVTLDPDAFSLGCAFGEDPLVAYLLRCAFPLIIIALFLILHTCTYAIPSRRWKKHRTANSIGQFSQTFFIASALTVFIPYQCYSHPDGSASVTSYSTILCGTADYVPFVAGSVTLLLLFPLPFLALTSYANWTAVGAASSAATRDRFLKTYRFLFYRFRPEVWWWGSVVYIRQLLLAISPMVAPDDPGFQVVFCIVILSIYLGILSYWPWKTNELNLLDNASTVFLIVMVAAVGSFMPPSTQAAHHEVVLWLVYALIFVSASAVIVFGLMSIVRKGTKGEFGYSTQSIIAENLSKQWSETCTAYAKLPLETSQHILMALNHYDRVRMLHVISSLQSVSHGCFLLSNDIAQKRLALEHSSWSSERIHEEVSKCLDNSGCPTGEANEEDAGKVSAGKSAWAHAAEASFDLEVEDAALQECSVNPRQLQMLRIARTD